jgi:hypothetical protein
MTLPRTSSPSASPDSTQSSRTPLSSKLDRKLIAYSAAASAASVGLLALTQTAEAKIVYTAASVTIPVNTTFNLDLNNDGIADFGFYFYTYGPRKPIAPPPLGYHQDNLVLEPSKAGNEAWSITSSKGAICAAALPPAAKVGPSGAFQPYPVLLAGSGGTAYSNVLRCDFEGKARGAFLGLKFLINGETHYGWAHVSAVYHNRARLDGYAYETVPNQPILTGKTNGPGKETSQSIPQIQPPVPAFASLGLLARGSSALAIWRKPEDDRQN